MVNYFLWKLEVTDCDFKILFLTWSQIVTLNNEIQTIKNRDVDSNATSSHPAQMNSALAFQFFWGISTSGADRCPLRQGFVG
jgi:hypothetical protein